MRVLARIMLRSGGGVSKYAGYSYANLQTAVRAIFAVAGVWTGPHPARHSIKHDRCNLRPFGGSAHELLEYSSKIERDRDANMCAS